MQYSEIRDGVVFVTLGSIINVKVAENLRVELSEFLDMGEKKIIIDFSKAEFIDSAGLGVLIEIRERLDESNGELILRGLKGYCLNLFEITCLTQDFRIEDEAQGS